MRFEDFSRFIELPVFVLLLLLRTNELKFWLLSIPKGSTSLMHLKQNHGSVQDLICSKSRNFKWFHLELTQNL